MSRGRIFAKNIFRISPKPLLIVAKKIHRELLPISCQNPVRIGGTSYASLQLAYNAAGNGGIGNTIQATRSIVIADSLDGSLDANINKSVMLQGGYDCNFTEPPTGQSYTYVKGSIQRTLGTLTLRNVILH